MLPHRRAGGFYKVTKDDHTSFAAQHNKSKESSLLDSFTIEMASDKPNVSEVKDFDHAKLKHVQTTEKNTLPNDESKLTSFRCSLGHQSCINAYTKLNFFSLNLVIKRLISTLFQTRLLLLKEPNVLAM